MSIFGFYFVASLLREAGWPRKQGLFKGDGYDTTITDAAIDQMVDWAASLGSGRPSIALQMIAEMFRDRNWESDDAPKIGTFVSGARKSWDSAPKAAPREVVQPIRLSKAFGTSISTSDFQDTRLRVELEQHVLEALLWGLANPGRFDSWYADAAQRHERSLDLMRKSGLEVEALPDLVTFFRQSEEIVRNYEREVSPLPSIPEKLLSDARGIGVQVNGAPMNSNALSGMSLGDTVQKFRDFYLGIKNLKGEEQLRKTLSVERNLAQNLDKDERAVFLALIDQMEKELLP